MLKRFFVAALAVVPLSGLSWNSTFYTGLGIGMDTTDFKQTAYFSQPGISNVIDQTQLAAQGVMGNLFAGYGYFINRFYLGSEINADLSDAQYHSMNFEMIHQNLAQTNYRISSAWGISVVPGVVLPASTLLYGKIGYVDGHYQVQTTDVSLANTSTMLSGVRYGVGISKNIYKNIDIRLEYSHISFENAYQFTFNASGKATKRTVDSPESNQFELDVDYRFI